MKNKQLPPLNSLKAFESAARHLSFTKAAEELFVTQAAISHQIKLLEDFLGISLFYRKNRTLELTELGESYFIDIRKILLELADITNKLCVQQNQQNLTISVPQTFGIHWLIPRLSEFNQLYPDIKVRIKGVDQDESLLNEEVDVAIYYGKGNWKGLQVEQLSQEKLLILASPKLLKLNPIYQVEDLRKHTLLHINNRDNWQNIAQFLRLEELNLQNGPLFSHTFMALQAAIHGQGIVLANGILAQQEIVQGNLQIALPTDFADPKFFYVVNQLSKMSDNKVQSFRNWIIQAIHHNNKEA